MTKSISDLLKPFMDQPKPKELDLHNFKMLQRLMLSMSPVPAFKDIDSFGRGIRSAVRGLWKGVLSEQEFTNSMISSIMRGFNTAWNEGAASCGIDQADRTTEEDIRLSREIQNDMLYIMRFASFIVSNSQANEGKLGLSLARAEMWTNRYNAVRSIAQQMACGDRKYKWHLGSTREHCSDCAAYAGRVHRASVWAKVGARPQGRNLECGGWKCQCRLELTEEPASPGLPPRPSGG